MEEIVSELKQLRDVERDLLVKLSPIQTKIKEIEEEIKERLIKLSLDKCSSGGLSFSLRRKTVPSIKDWESLVGFVKNTSDYELFTRRLRESRCQSLWENGVEIPGVDKYQVITIGVAKHE